MATDCNADACANSECWYGLKEAEIEKLESLDLTFFRNLFEVPHTVPTVGLYLKTGSLNKSENIVISVVFVEIGAFRNAFKILLGPMGKPRKI